LTFNESTIKRPLYLHFINIYEGSKVLHYCFLYLVYSGEEDQMWINPYPDC
jgi:hypothetical protein